MLSRRRDRHSQAEVAAPCRAHPPPHFSLKSSPASSTSHATLPHGAGSIGRQEQQRTGARHESAAPTRLVLDGDAEQCDWFGEYAIRSLVVVNNRPFYLQAGNQNRAIWHAEGRWRVGRVTDIGEATGWLVGHDESDGMQPSPCSATAWSSGDSLANHLRPTTGVACVGTDDFETHLRAQIREGSALSDRIGNDALELRRVSGRLHGSTPLYVVTSPLEQRGRAVFHAGGAWHVQVSADAVCRLTDHERLLGAHKEATLLKLSGGASARHPPCVFVDVRLPIEGSSLGPSASKRRQCHKWTGAFRLLDGLVNGSVVYARYPAEDVLLWRIHPHWYVGPASAVGTSKGFVHCESRAECPQDISEDAACIANLADLERRVAEGADVDGGDGSCSPPQAAAHWQVWNTCERRFEILGEVAIERVDQEEEAVDTPSNPVRTPSDHDVPDSGGNSGRATLGFVKCVKRRARRWLTSESPVIWASV